jgi:hypothetical protein
VGKKFQIENLQENFQIRNKPYEKPISAMSAEQIFDERSQKLPLFPVLWIRTGPDPHHLAGSGRIRIILPDPDSDRRRHLGHADPVRGSVSIPNTCIFYFFHENFNMLSKIIKIMTHLPLMRKEKYYKLVLL